MFDLFQTGKHYLPHYLFYYLLVPGYASVLCQPLGGRHRTWTHHFWHPGVPHIYLLEGQASLVNQDFR